MVREAHPRKGQPEGWPVDSWLAAEDNAAQLDSQLPTCYGVGSDELTIPSMLKSPFLKLAVAVVAVLAVVGVGYAGLVTWRHNQATEAELTGVSVPPRGRLMPELPSPVESGPSAVDSIDWVTYRNSKWGIEVEHPNDWEVRIHSRDIVFTNLSSGSEFAVKKEDNPINLTLDEWFRRLALVQGRPTAKASARPVTINGHKAYRLDRELAPLSPLFEVYIADGGGRIFTLSAYRANEADTDVLKRVLSTFRFIGS